MEHDITIKQLTRIVVKPFRGNSQTVFTCAHMYLHKLKKRKNVIKHHLPNNNVSSSQVTYMCEYTNSKS